MTRRHGDEANVCVSMCPGIYCFQVFRYQDTQTFECLFVLELRYLDT